MKTGKLVQREKLTLFRKVFLGIELYVTSKYFFLRTLRKF